jgi:hypothetical protein
MSSTSMTSTSGVMLISFITSSVSSCVPKAIYILPAASTQLRFFMGTTF